MPGSARSAAAGRIIAGIVRRPDVTEFHPAAYSTLERAMSISTDAELMERYARGEASAFDALFGRYDRNIFSFFFRRTRCPERAADLHQELFLKLHRFRDRFDATRDFAPWLFALARNIWHDDLRRGLDLPVPSESAAGELADDSFLPHLEAAADARHLLGALAPQQRDLILATAVVGFSYREVAPRFGSSATALKQAGARSLRRLRRLHDEQGP